MITFKFEYNAETKIATYWLYRDGVPDEMIGLTATFEVANGVAEFIQYTINISAEDSAQKLLNKLGNFVDSYNI